MIELDNGLIDLDKKSSEEGLPNKSTQPFLDSPRESLEWTASSYVNHTKSVTWYSLFVLTLLVVSGLIWLWTKDVVTVVVVIVSALALLYYSNLKPKQVVYKLDYKNIYVNNKIIALKMFHSFNIVRQDSFQYIVLYLCWLSFPCEHK